MLKVLVPIDGSDSSHRAVDHLLKQLSWYRDGVEIHLLNVQHPLPGAFASLIGHGAKQHHEEEGRAALRTATQKLDAAGVKYTCHITVGEPAEMIARFAKEKNCDEIVMGSRGLGATASLLLGSVATKVMHLSDVPVMLVK